MLRASDIFNCCLTGCDKVGTTLCSSCHGARYCGKLCQKRHWGSTHKHVCQDLKAQRLSKWHEISVLATAYAAVIDDVFTLLNAVTVWRNVSAAKGQHLPLTPLLARLDRIETALRSKDHAALRLQDTELIADSETSSRSLCNACLVAVEGQILASVQNHENSLHNERFYQQLLSTFDFVETLHRYNFVALKDPSKTAYEFRYLETHFYRVRGVLLSMQGRSEEAVESYLAASEVCKAKACNTQKFRQHLVQASLDRGMLLKALERLPEAISAFEEAYSVQCELSGPADQKLQVIAVELADALRQTGDFERAEHFSRVTYEMTKEHRSAATTSLGFNSAAASRSEILTEVMRKQPNILTGAQKDDVLREAELLAREALAEATEDRHKVTALRQLLNVLVERDTSGSRDEAYTTVHRLIRMNQSNPAPASCDRKALSNYYSTLALLLRKRQDEAHAAGTCFNSGDDKEVRETTCFVDKQNNDEWNPVCMKMRVYYCLLKATVMHTIESVGVDEQEQLMIRLESAAFFVLDGLVTSGRLDLSGSVVVWKDTTWEAFIEECKQKVDHYIDREIIQEKVAEGTSGTSGAIGIFVNAKSVTEPLGGGVENAGATILGSTVAAGENEREISLGFAYLSLGSVLLKIVNGTLKLLGKRDVDSTEMRTPQGAIVAAEDNLGGTGVDYGQESCSEEVFKVEEEKVENARLKGDADDNGIVNKNTVGFDAAAVDKEVNRVFQLTKYYFERNVAPGAAEASIGPL